MTDREIIYLSSDSEGEDNPRRSAAYGPSLQTHHRNGPLISHYREPVVIDLLRDDHHSHHRRMDTDLPLSVLHGSGAVSTSPRQPLNGLSTSSRSASAGDGPARTSVTRGTSSQSLPRPTAQARPPLRWTDPKWSTPPESPASGLQETPSSDSEGEGDKSAIDDNDEVVGMPASAEAFASIRTRRTCLSCSELGVGCDGEQPCSTCAEPGIDCHYPGEPIDTGKSYSTLSAKLVSPAIVTPSVPIIPLAARASLVVKEGHAARLALDGDGPLEVTEQPSEAEGYSSDESAASSSVQDVEVELEEVRLLMQKLQTELPSYQEYAVQSSLRQAKSDCRRRPKPKLDFSLRDPFQPVPAQTGGSECNGTVSKGPTATTTTLQAHVKLHGRGVLSNKWKPLLMRVTRFKIEVMKLPKYKSIGRVGPSLLAPNVRTAKYRPYDAADESEDPALLKKYNELEQRYNHDFMSMKRQRECQELIGLWRPWADELLRQLKIQYSDVLYYFMHEPDPTWRPNLDMSDASRAAWTSEQREACRTCKVEGMESKWNDVLKWSERFNALPIPDGRSLALAGLASFAFHEVTKVSLWHIASMAAASSTTIRTHRSLDGNASQGTTASLCAVCFLHNCPIHGGYEEPEDDDQSRADEAFIDDEEKEHNLRKFMSLPVRFQGEGHSHLCGLYCVDRSLILVNILGRRADGSVSGAFRPVVQTHPALADDVFCSDACFWNVKIRRKSKVSELAIGNLSPIPPAHAALFSAMMPAFLNNKRGPCMMAAVIKDMSCLNIFYHMLSRIAKTAHEDIPPGEPLGLHDIPTPPVRRGPKPQTEIDTRMSAELDLRAPFEPCSHEGPCQNNPDCSCAQNKVSCEWFCGCDLACKRRFKGCTCAGVSKTCFSDDRCQCWRANRECDPWLCKSCGVMEVLDSSNRYNDEIRKGRCKNNRIQLDLPARTVKAPSEVQGYGLFAGEDLEEHAYIGEYRGEIISIQESDRRGAVYHNLGQEYLFVLNTAQQMDASNFGNKMRFMNNSQRDANINVVAKKMLCSGVQRVMLYAKRPIKAGEELLYNYNYPVSVVKNFWEPGEKPTNSTGGVLAILPKTTDHAAVNGRFARTAPNRQARASTEDEREDEESPSPLAVRRKRKRNGEGMDMEYTAVVPAKVDNDTADSLMEEVLDVPVIDEPDDSDYHSTEHASPSSASGEPLGSEGEDDSDHGSLSKPQATVLVRRRKVGPNDRRRGGKAQKQAWRTRKKNMAEAASKGQKKKAKG